MKLTISHASQFRDEFRQAGRQDQFSYEALNMLYEYFEDIDPDMELDAVAICCDYSEEDAKDIFNTYPISCDSDSPSDEEVIEAVRNYLQENTTLVGETSSGFVYAAF